MSRLAETDRQPRARLAPTAWRDPLVLLATGFGSGFVRPAPGTWGTLAALAIWWLLLAGAGWALQVAALLLVSALGLWLIRRVEERYGVHDDPAIVVDEFAGLWLALLIAPAGVFWVLGTFLAFRLFDIAKPWPVGWADRRVPGALGVMLDDLFAGALAGTVLQLAFWAAVWLAWFPAP
jgi:phosphatidylglycerophosphatase A